MEGNRKERPFSDDGWCYVCGPHNPNGLRLKWSLSQEGVALARFHPAREHQGWRDVVHGGILAALLDEAMAQWGVLNGRPTVTGAIEIRYRQPAPTDAPLLAEARMVADRGRVLRLEASVRNEGTGIVYASARGTCFRIWPEGNGCADSTAP